MPAGRKSLREEIGVLRRYADLTEPYFKFLKETMEGEDKDEKKWAVEVLTKAFVKMIPQTIDGEGENGEIQIQIVKYTVSEPDTTTLQIPAPTISDTPPTSV